MLQYKADCNVTVVGGVSSSGKTSFVIRYLLNAQLTTRFIFDPRGEFADRMNLPSARTAAELEEAAWCGWCCFDPSHQFPGQPKVALDKFCEFVFEQSGKMPGEKVLVIDELWKYCSPHSIPQSLATIAQDGRKNGVGLMVATQRVNKINEAILNEAREWVCFRLRGNHGLETAAEYGDFDEDELRSLPNLHFVAENVDSGCVVRGQLLF